HHINRYSNPTLSSCPCFIFPIHFNSINFSLYNYLPPPSIHTLSLHDALPIAALDVAPGARVTLVESATASLGAADTGGQDVDGVRRVGSRVETFLEGVRPGGADTGPDVVVLDPPRGGAGIDVMVRLSELTRARIVHVGCDPASLARDVGVLVAAGWTLVDLSGVAAFPGTHHV